MEEQKKTETAEAAVSEKKPEKKKRRRRFGDRADGRKLHKLPILVRFTPYIMPRRSDSLIYFSDSIEISHIEEYCRGRVKNGDADFSLLYVIIAAYLRMICERPALNRFVCGQKIYAHNDVAIVMAVKRSMRLDSEETCIKVHFDKEDTIDEVYRKFHEMIAANKQENQKSAFDKVNGGLLKIPGFLCAFVVRLLNLMDHLGIMPKALIEVSPFHGSMIITSMGSLGINPVYHHIYDFGTLPVFISYGTRRNKLELDAEGKVIKKKVVDLKVVLDERICDGFYYASSLKVLKNYIEHPELLEEAPKTVLEDVD